MAECGLPGAAELVLGQRSDDDAGGPDLRAPCLRHRHGGVGNREVPVTEEPVLVTPFGTLLRFRKDIDSAQPRVLVVAPLSGHFATLLRDTVKTLLADHDVYITDWHNARDVPLSDGAFGFDDYVDHLVQLPRGDGPGRPCRRRLPARRSGARGRGRHGRDRRTRPCPRSMTLMAGPVDSQHQPDQGERARHRRSRSTGSRRT